MKVQPVILCGGAGTRLWPLSREHFPKQLLALDGDDTLLQATMRRLDGAMPELEESAPPLVVCNREHRFMVAEQLRAAGLRLGTLIPEPAGRGTAPALTLAALHARAAGDPVLLAMPAGHVLPHLPAFQDAGARGASLASAEDVVSFGVPPGLAGPGDGDIRVRVVDETVHAPDG